MPAPFLIKNATVIQEGHPRHLKQSDILISNGRIEKIAAKIDAKAQLIQGDDLRVSVGFHDLRSHLSDPGMEYKEDLSQLLETAAAGGFTSISTLPATQPVVDHKSAIQYIVNKSASALTDVYPMGAVSEKMEGVHLAELYDLHEHGAIAFTDADRNLSSGLLKKALLYVQPFNGLIVSLPLNRSLHHDGMVNESPQTVSTGLKTRPAIAEYSQLRQQLDVLEYCGGRIHFTGISTAESVRLIKEAKKKGLHVTCDVALYNLCFTDKEVQQFDANFKCLPILRSEKDRKALIKGIQEGVVDAICSNHHAQNVEVKRVEFDYAETGTINLQTAQSLYEMFLKDQLDEATFIKCWTSNPRTLLGIEVNTIAEGEAANLVVFDRKGNWKLDITTNKSGGTNTHLWNTALRGKVIATFNQKSVNFY